MQEETQRKLNELKTKYLNSPDSLDYIDEVEKELRKLIDEKNHNLNNSIFKAIVSDAEKKLADINSLLLNSEELSVEDRKQLFREKKIWKFIFSRFGTSLYDEAIRTLENIIDSKHKG